MEFVEIFEAGAARGASDVILTAGEPPIYRVDGLLSVERDRGHRLSADDCRRLIYAILREEQVVKLEAERELDFSFRLKPLGRYRANIFFQRGAIGATFRTIPTSIPRLADLQLPSILSDLALSAQGLILVTGPTGSGKSTTLAAMIDEVNRARRVHIITIEDPIEYVHDNQLAVIEQREVGEDTLSFNSALRHVLRQDPDVILIGELRDLETMQTAITAAETGHLVLATLHTNDCVQAVDRLIDVFPAGAKDQVRSQLSACLLAVMSQRLLPRIDRPGRIAATELMMATTAVRSLIRENKLHQIYSMMETGSQHGMYTIDHSLKALLRRGQISHGEARQRARHPELIRT